MNVRTETLNSVKSWFPRITGVKIRKRNVELFSGRSREVHSVRLNVDAASRALLDQEANVDELQLKVRFLWDDAQKLANS